MYFDKEPMELLQDLKEYDDDYEYYRLIIFRKSFFSSFYKKIYMTLIFFLTKGTFLKLFTCTVMTTMIMKEQITHM